MFIRSNKVLVAMLLLVFIFVPHVGQTGSSEAESVIKEICTSVKNAIKNMSPIVMLGTIIAIILFMVVFKGFIVLVLISGMFFILFGNPKEIVDSVKEKINLVVNNMDSKEKIKTSSVEHDRTKT